MSVRAQRKPDSSAAVPALTQLLHIRPAIVRMSCEITPDMEAFFKHLSMHQSLVRAGMEFSPSIAGWWFARVCDGRGYLMSLGLRGEIGAGDLMVVPAAAGVSLRASQLGDLRLCHFGVLPEQLIGFFTVEEQQALNAAAANRESVPRIVRREDAVAAQHASLCEARQCEPGALVRSAVLALAVRAWRDMLTQMPPKPAPYIGSGNRFAELVARVPESGLLNHSAKELARQCGCSERHLRRLFVQRFGVPLLQRQIAWRIERAKKLLVETEAKVIDIAGQCGFHSLGQFNKTFKQLTRFSPGAWRKAMAGAKARHKRRHPPLCPRQNRLLQSVA
jgi:AraC-like DNA-binding protein